MSTPTTEAIPTPRWSPAERLLVWAPGIGLDEPRTALADGTYETSQERVFWRTDRTSEVLRVPLELPVAVRSVRHFPPQPRQPSGEQALLAAVRAGRPKPDSAPCAVIEPDHELLDALQSGDITTAHALAALVWKRSGITAVYGALSGCLAQLGAGWADGSGSVLAEHRATRTASQVAERLRAVTAKATRCGTVVLAVPPGEHHLLALSALAHQLEESGWPVQVVDDLPLPELVVLASQPGTLAVVFSTHTRMSVAQTRRLLGPLRKAGPEVLLVVGGPGQAPTRNPHALGADLVTDDVTLLARALHDHASALTDRERQVLQAVAEGKTNAAIARLLGVAPATVKSHLDNILLKTGTEHRAAAVARALRHGWIG